jgi:hypothetical protein
VRSTGVGGITLSLDPNTTIQGSSFLSGKFRLRATATAFNVERFDDDGAVVTDSWQRIAAFSWGDTSGAFHVNSIKAFEADHVTVDDNLRVANNAVVVGSLIAGPTTVDMLTAVTTVTSAIVARDNGGVVLLTPDSVPAFTAKSDRNCQCWASLDVRNNINCSGGVTTIAIDTMEVKSNVLLPSVGAEVEVRGDLRVTGALYASIPSPFHVAGRVNGLSGTVILSSKGRYDFTFVRISQGFYKMTWSPAHPDGSNFICLAQGEGTGGTWNILHDGNSSFDLANSPTSVTFIVRNNTFALTDGIINFTILA